MSFRMYVGGAGGSAQKALRRLEYPDVLISYLTKNNRPWGGIERLAVDSGGYSMLLGAGEYETPASEYVEYLKANERPLEWFALRDYPVSPEVLSRNGRTVEEHQERTVAAHIDVLDALDERPVDADAVAILQGSTAEEYVEHLGDLEDAGVLDRVARVGVGSLVGRNPEVVEEIVARVREVVPDEYPLHGFGVGRDDLAVEGIVRALDSADSCAYERAASRAARKRGRSCNWQYVMGHLTTFIERIEELRIAAESAESRKYIADSRPAPGVENGRIDEFTKRDKVWIAVAALLREAPFRFRTSEVRERAGLEASADRTVRTVLKGMAKLGILDHEENGNYWYPGAYGASAADLVAMAD